MTKKVGVDMGGTWLRAGIVEEDGRISRIVKQPTPDNWDSLVSVLSPYDGEDIEGFGVAISGPIADHPVKGVPELGR